jgi:predicted DNA-binding protein
MDPSKQSPIIGIQDLEDLNLASQITHEIKRVEKTYLSLVLN